jgi:hypothetical protein
LILPKRKCSRGPYLSSSVVFLRSSSQMLRSLRM